MVRVIRFVTEKRERWMQRCYGRPLVIAGTVAKGAKKDLPSIYSYDNVNTQKEVYTRLIIPICRIFSQVCNSSLLVRALAFQ